MAYYWLELAVFIFFFYPISVSVFSFIYSLYCFCLSFFRNSRTDIFNWMLDFSKYFNVQIENFSQYNKFESKLVGTIRNHLMWKDFINQLLASVRMKTLFLPIKTVSIYEWNQFFCSKWFRLIFENQFHNNVHRKYLYWPSKTIIWIQGNRFYRMNIAQFILLDRQFAWRLMGFVKWVNTFNLTHSTLNRFFSSIQFGKIVDRSIMLFC